eukprot:gb/GECG01011703.1/.p1 GENE.gb/GECG01011703.1/~~gb/GECG01011703.1/.p1  ORF type:complete len:195 (+),score=7.21 gb/GECG01011703.1/:1-585(+)
MAASFESFAYGPYSGFNIYRTSYGTIMPRRFPFSINLRENGSCELESCIERLVAKLRKTGLQVRACKDEDKPFVDFVAWRKGFKYVMLLKVGRGVETRDKSPLFSDSDPDLPWRYLQLKHSDIRPAKRGHTIRTYWNIQRSGRTVLEVFDPDEDLVFEKTQVVLDMLNFPPVRCRKASRSRQPAVKCTLGSEIT